MMDYPWYELTKDDQILQGDFFYSVPFLEPLSDIRIEEFEYKSGLYDVIVISQSCDLILKKLKTVIVCPIWTLEQFSDKKSDYKKKGRREKLRKGEIIGYHLLNKCDLEGFESDFLIVDFKSVFSIPLTYLQNIIEKKENRIRLLPPYREHLSQAFARFVMRVGLPSDIPKFE